MRLYRVDVRIRLNVASRFNPRLFERRDESGGKGCSVVGGAFGGVFWFVKGEIFCLEYDFVEYVI